jgi:DeoR/GlpR family transcriptional regulator of sugar metabolism
VLAAIRRERILDYMRASGSVAVKELAKELRVSEMTVRRDLEAMESNGLLVRTRGGALARGGLTAEVPYQFKRTQNTQQKRRIAAAAVSLVSPGQTIVLDSGSTTLEVARILKHTGKEFTVVTNDVKILMELATCKAITTISTGGVLEVEFFTLLGYPAEAFLRGIAADFAFVGTSAVDIEMGVTTPTMEKVPIKQAMLRTSPHKVLLADATKFGVRSRFQVCPLRELDSIITDQSLDTGTLDRMRELGMNVELV